MLIQVLDIVEVVLFSIRTFDGIDPIGFDQGLPLSVVAKYLSQRVNV